MNPPRTEKRPGLSPARHADPLRRPVRRGGKRKLGRFHPVAKSADFFRRLGNRSRSQPNRNPVRHQDFLHPRPTHSGQIGGFSEGNSPQAIPLDDHLKRTSIEHFFHPRMFHESAPNQNSSGNAPSKSSLIRILPRNCPNFRIDLLFSTCESPAGSPSLFGLNYQRVFKPKSRRYGSILSSLEIRTRSSRIACQMISRSNGSLCSVRGSW